MTYELAKQLKDAGFPLDKNFRCGHCGCNENQQISPTLSELIEAVKGGKPNSFYLEYNDEWSVYEEPNSDGLWYARYYYLTPIGFIEERADTPEEAVAKLWLELNNLYGKSLADLDQDQRDMDNIKLNIALNKRQ